MTDNADADGDNATPDDDAEAHRQEVKAEFMAFYEQRQALLASGRGVPAPHPEKFDFPIGLDNEGNPFPMPAKADDDEGSTTPESP